MNNNPVKHETRSDKTIGFVKADPIGRPFGISQVIILIGYSMKCDSVTAKRAIISYYHKNLIIKLLKHYYIIINRRKFVITTLNFTQA